MRILVLTVLAIWLSASVVSLAYSSEHAHKPHPHKHAKYAKVKNPFPMEESSIMKGKDLYERHCIACHGEGGKGSGNLDLTDDFWIHGNTDGEMFHVIMDGAKGTVMRGFRKELTKDMRWHLVNYVKSLKKTSDKEMKK